MYFAIIPAGGVGTRMGGVDKPKQYLDLEGKPIIIHTIEKFIREEFEKIIVACPEDYVDYTNMIVESYLRDPSKVVVIKGGEDRNGSIMNAIDYIEEKYGLDADTYIITHDSVRPFLSGRVLEENLALVKECGACITAVPSTDTIAVSEDKVNVKDIPNRSTMYQVQTPQSFRAMELKDAYASLSPDEKAILTDASKIYLLKGKQVKIVQGDIFNIKITYPSDLKVAEGILKLRVC